eukprot:11823877-Ditylum_brightwellii.AAC.1
MIAFGTQTTLTRFKDRYLNYKGAVGGDGNVINKDDNGLAICSFEAAFCADLCATYIFKMGNGLVISLGKLTQTDLAKWLKEFQHKVDNLIEGNFFNFTAEIWAQDEEVEEEETAINDQIEKKLLEKVKVIQDHTFPFLDMQMEWKDKMLTFSVYAKPNHTIKYVGNMSCHQPTVFKAIPAGITMETVNKPITELYPVQD